MNRQYYFNYIERELNLLTIRINSRGRLNLLEMHNHAEVFYQHFLNNLYKWKLEDANKSKQNLAAIDLIDNSNKLIIQVSATKTKSKIETALKKEIIKQYSDYTFIFISIANDADDLRDAVFKNPYQIKFNPKEHIIDKSRILRDIRALEINELEKIFDLLKQELADVPETKYTFDKKNRSHQSKLYVNLPTSLPYFTGRTKILNNISCALDTYRKASLHGIHGLGKSSIVNEFAHKYWLRETNIIFIRANDLDTEVNRVVKDLGISTSNETTSSEILEILRNWLRQNRDWLLILDNVDDVEKIQLCDFPFDNGYVLLTSNDDKIHDIGHRVEIENMVAEDAVLLLCRHQQRKQELSIENISPGSYENACKIADKFGNSPLAMTFVGSYLAEERQTFADFLDFYGNRESNLLTKYKFLSNYQHKEVATAFLLTIERISKQNSNSPRDKLISEAIKGFLKLCVYLSPDRIPEELLYSCVSKLHPSITTFTKSKVIFQIRKRLCSFSLFEGDPDSKTLTTHRIVQEVMKFQINSEEDLLLETLIESLIEQTPIPSYTNKYNFELFKNHLETILDYLERNKIEEGSSILRIENESTARLCGLLARYYELFGQYEISLKYYEAFKHICEKIPDIEKHWIAISYNNLSSLYKSQGRYDEAEHLCREELAIIEEIFGVEASSTATTYNNLGEIYRSQGKYAEAEVVLKKALAICEKYKEYFDMPSAYNNLALIYKTQGKFTEAEQLYYKAIIICEKKVGKEHPEMVPLYSNLADLYRVQKRFSLAEMLNKQALAICENVIGLKNIETAKVHNKLGVLYYDQRKFSNAKVHLEKSLYIYQAKLGENHSRTISEKKNLRNLKLNIVIRRWLLIIFLLWVLSVLIRIFWKVILQNE